MDLTSPVLWIVIGAVLGGWLFGLLGVTVGAIVLLFVAGLFS